MRGDYSLIKKNVAFKFCVKNKIKCSHIIIMLTVAFKETTPLVPVEINKIFTVEDQEYVDDIFRSGRPTTSITDKDIRK